MEYWEYDELFDAIQEDYNDYMNLNRGYRYAIARLVDEYWNLGEIEDVVVATAIGEVLITHDKVFVGNIEHITKCLNTFNPLDAVGELAQKEISDLSTRIKKVLEGLKKVEVDYNPNAEQQ
ncbi:Imm3 family immunity protein [Priestia endophytica]